VVLSQEYTFKWFEKEMRGSKREMEINGVTFKLRFDGINDRSDLEAKQTAAEDSAEEFEEWCSLEDEESDEDIGKLIVIE